MTKLLENIYRCVNIALVNELKLLCLRMGIDIWEVIGAAATKPFGFQPFYPGPGLGGHCIPIDPFYLSWKAKEFDFSTRFIELAGEVNEAMPYHVVAAVSSALNQRSKPLKGSRILVLGLAYKRDVDDLRESPSLSIIEMLQQEGAAVSYNDPFFPTVGRGRKYNLNMKSQPLDNLDGYDCLLIVTDHTSYDYARIVKEVAAGRGLEERNQRAGFGKDCALLRVPHLRKMNPEDTTTEKPRWHYLCPPRRKPGPGEQPEFPVEIPVFQSQSGWKRRKAGRLLWLRSDVSTLVTRP